MISIHKRPALAGPSGLVSYRGSTSAHPPRHRVRPGLRAGLMSAALAATTSGAFATLHTYSYTIPAGGFDLQAPLDPLGDPSATLTSFTSTPYAKVVGFSWSDLSLTTLTDTWGSDISVGFGGRGSHTETVISARPFFDQDETGTFGPLSTSFDLTTNSFYVSSTGHLPLLAFSNYDNGGPSQGTLHAGTITVTVDDAILEPPVVPPVATNIGSLAATAPGGQFTVSGSLAAGEVGWYKFTLDGPVAPGELMSFLDIATNGTPFDTELALYDATGNLVAFDDDSGFDTNSLLTFGTGSGLLLGDYFGDDVFGDGFNGNLAAGTYYLGIGGFYTDFEGGFEATPDPDSEGGDYTLTFIGAQVSAVPEPTALAPLLLAPLLLRRVRR